MEDESALGLPGFDPPPAPAPAPAAYRVLARKYRPGNFDALLGQDAMVQTLANAIARDRLAQAWLLTGVRGVGKTSTARIIAKALNCIGPDGQGGPTINPCGVCDPCRSITEGRHMDVVEMDAASNTGVDDVREIIEGVRYAAVSARYKIHIIDEVHMLTKNAFNALLKTLEEPPPHVKFIFATTEVNKVPVTVLSRCQRFDLRRVPADLLTSHFARIVAQEGAEAEPEALALIARAAEGSVRDGLSILDQAIAHAGGAVAAAAVRDMLGLADKSAVRSLLGQMLAGDAAGALDGVARQYALGLDPEQLLRELLDLVHGITRHKLAPLPDPALSAEEQVALGDWAARLNFSRLHSLWQLLLKGLAEVQSAPVPLQAAEMAILRVIHAADLPDPGQLLKRLHEGGALAAGRSLPSADPAPPPHVPVGAAPPPAGAIPTNYEALIGLFRQQKEARLAHILHDEVRLVDYAPGAMTLAASGLEKDVHLAIARCLKAWTGQDWHIRWQAEGGGPTLRETELAARDAAAANMRADPTVAALLARFPDADIEMRTPHAQSG